MNSKWRLNILKNVATTPNFCGFKDQFNETDPKPKSKERLSRILKTVLRSTSPRSTLFEYLSIQKRMAMVIYVQKRFNSC